jgi:hypothetical protein
MNVEKTYGFIILRHVNNKINGQYWKISYNCIRKLYPENNIMIIDDNSNYEFIDDKDEKNLYKTTIIKSEFPGRGELLPYYYYLKNKIFDTACIIHDSVFINKYIDIKADKYKLLWEFEHNSDQIEDETLMLGLFLDKDKEIIDFYNKKELWKGCFGGMTIINYDYLEFINNKYDLSNLIPLITSRYNRCSFERVLACLLQKNYKKECLLGNIHRYCRWGININELNNYLHLPVIKVWSGR